MSSFQSRTSTSFGRRCEDLRRSTTLALCAGLAAGSLAGMPVAHGQAAMDVARGAFERGLAHDAAGHPDEACVAYRESLGLVRELGPLRKVAACDARARRIRSATVLLEELLRRLPPDGGERSEVVAELEAVRRRAAHLALSLKPGTPAGVRVSVDGEVVAVPAADLVVDPGSHTVLVEAPGATPSSSVIELGEGARETVMLSLAAPASDRDRSTPAPVPATAGEGPGRPLRTAGWIVGGVGAAGFVGVAITGGLLLGEQSDFATCRDTAGCDAPQRADDAQPLIVANTIAWGLGIAGVGVGATLLIVDAASSGGESRVEAVVAPGRAAIRGRF